MVHNDLVLGTTFDPLTGSGHQSFHTERKQQGCGVLFSSRSRNWFLRGCVSAVVALSSVYMIPPYQGNTESQGGVGGRA